MGQIKCDFCERCFDSLNSMTNHRRWHNLPKYKKFQILHNKVRSGDNSSCWKGDKAGYHALHKWVRKHLPNSGKCWHCGLKKPLDCANKRGVYSRDLKEWEWLCRSCHVIKDGIMVSLWCKRKKNSNQYIKRKEALNVNKQSHAPR